MLLHVFRLLSVPNCQNYIYYFLPYIVASHINLIIFESIVFKKLIDIFCRKVDAY